MKIRDIDLDTGRERIGSYPIAVTDPVAGFYLWFLENADGGRFQKLVVNLLTESALKRKLRTEDMLDVLVINELLPPELGEAEDEASLRCSLLDILHQSIRREAQNRGWDLAPFDAAYFQARPHIISQEIVALAQKWNRSRNLSAEVILRWTSTDAVVRVLVRDKTGELVKEEVVAETIPSTLKFANVLGHLSWKDRNTVVLRARNKSKEWRVVVGG